MNLLPKPQMLEIKDGFLQSKVVCVNNLCADERIAKALWVFEQCESGLPLTLKCSDGIGEGYTLDICGSGITITGNSSAGVFYGIQTLRQIFENHAVPCMHIEDKPDMGMRGFYHDVTRGRVPTVAALKKLVDALTYYKMNSLQLYIEHTFPFSEFGDAYKKFGCLTPDEIKELDDYCYDNFIELVPSIATFGHLYELLQLDEYKDLRTIADYKQRFIFWIERMEHHTIDPLNPKSIDVVKSLIDQSLPLYRSDKFNICCDETFDLKTGKHKDGDVGRIYVDFVKQIIAHLKSKGKKVMMWGDIALQHPETIKELACDTDFLHWWYDPSPNEDDFKTLCDAGCNMIVCPGTNSWHRLIEGIDTGSKNICAMLDLGYKYGAKGMLNTNWGDYGHPCPLELSMHGLVLGAAKSWNKFTCKDDDFNRSINALLYKNDKAVDYLTLLDTASNLISYRLLVWAYSNCLQYDYLEFDYPTKEDIHKATEICQSVIADLNNQQWEKDEYRSELIICAQGIILMSQIFAKLAGYTRDSVIDASLWLERYRASWLASNKESELCEIEKMFKFFESI